MSTATAQPITGRSAGLPMAVTAQPAKASTTKSAS